MTDREGWICPVCKRGVAPGEKSCDHGGQQAVPNSAPIAIPTPFFAPGFPSQQFAAKCGCPAGTVCGNTACPNRLIVTCTNTCNVSGHA